MSVHTLISSNITDYGALTGLLDQIGVPWHAESGVHLKATGRPAVHAVVAIIGGERVLIFQMEEGRGFKFQSQGWWFRNKGAIEGIANAISTEQLSQQRILSEQQRVEAERQASVTRERRRQEQERQRQEAADRQRIADQQRQAEEEQKRAAEQRRQQKLAEDANQLLQRLDSERKAVPELRQTAPAAVQPVPQLAEARTSATSSDEMDRLIGKLHQADALRKIKDHLPELKEKFGATLDREETFDDDTIELRLTL
jgi:hypothetical protein